LLCHTASTMHKTQEHICELKARTTAQFLGIFKVLFVSCMQTNKNIFISVHTYICKMYIHISIIYIYIYNHSPREVCHCASRQHKCAAPVVKTQPSPLTQSREKKDFEKTTCWKICDI
jgi:hypothetical protein